MASRPVAKEDVYIDSRGNFVKGDDPNVHIQLAHKGVAIPQSVQKLHGLDENGSYSGKRSKYFEKFNIDLVNPAGPAPEPAKPKAPEKSVDADKSSVLRTDSVKKASVPAKK